VREYWVVDTDLDHEIDRRARPPAVLTSRRMRRRGWPVRRALAGVGLGVSVALAACAPSTAGEQYFGRVTPPDGQVLRYISGSEPESFDPQIGTGQPEARVYLAFFEGLTEFDPKTGEATPALAEHWEMADANTTFTFHLRPQARWSDGSPITASDVVYTLRRGLAPALAARNTYMAYDIAYAEAYNGAAMFVRDVRTGDWLRDDADPALKLVVPGDAAARDALPAAVRARLQGHTLVPVRAEDVGVEALDAHTVRFHLARPVPFFPGLLGHQFFRLVPRAAIERHGAAWTRPEHLIASGAFVLAEWKPYDRFVAVRNPMYWDAASVRLDRIIFYPVEDQTTMMNLYKSGAVDATFNHTVPAAWVDQIRGLRDYMDAPENAAEFYYFNTTEPPTDDVRVRKALNLAVDRVALAQYRKTAQPLTGLVPAGIFPGYPNPAGLDFDPARAKQLLADAGYADARGAYDPSRFPSGSVQIVYNTNESNRQVAEFVQAQWKQHLGLTVALRNEEFRTFLGTRARREYKGIARSGWVGDYMDPFTFLDLLSTPGGNNGSGWTDPRYTALLRQANREADPAMRLQTLARAEALMLEAQPVLALLTTNTNWLRKPYVKGLYPNPLTMHAWKHVYIEHDPAKWN
jgi:ABC-type oligopeptide transport system substrate-binding subunit